MSEYIDNLQSYMLTCKNISTFTRYIDEVKPLPKVKEYKNDKVSQSVFIPYQNDKLFWIYYFIRYGYVEYNMVGSKSYSTEMDHKVLLVDKIKKSKAVLKDYKLKRIDEVSSSLLSMPEINFKTFEILCILYKFNFIFIKENMYHKVISDDAENIYIIHMVNGLYGCERIHTNELENYEKNRYHVEYYEKPIASVGSFKSDELVDIANQLDISLTDDNNKKLKKNELYNYIAIKLNNFFCN